MALEIDLPDYGQTNWHIPLNVILNALAGINQFNWRGTITNGMVLAVGDVVRIPWSGQVLVTKTPHVLNAASVVYANFEVLIEDGVDGADGAPGDQGIQGIPGTPGTPGTNGTGFRWMGDITSTAKNLAVNDIVRYYDAIYIVKVAHSHNPGTPVPANFETWLNSAEDAGMGFTIIGPNDPLPAPAGIPLVIFRDS